MTIKSVSEYAEGVDIGFVKYAQIKIKTFPFGKTHSVAHWIFYADALPEFEPSDSNIVSITNPDIKEGWFYNEDETFSSPETSWQNLYSDEELLMYIRRERNNKLSCLDALFIRHQSQLLGAYQTSISADQFSEFISYQQALRDFPATADVRAPVWPTLPDCLAYPSPFTAPTVTAPIDAADTSISGTSTNVPNGKTITVFKNGTQLGTTTVTDNAWTLGTIVVAENDSITAKAGQGCNLSAASTAVVVVA